MGITCCHDGGARTVEEEDDVISALPADTAASSEPTKQKQSEKAAQMLLSVFKYYDKNKDGTLSLKELKQGIAQTGLTLDYMKAADTDGDQKVSKEEFVNFFDPIPDKEVDEMREWLLEKQSPAATAMLLEVFAKYDKSGDGLLSVAEITKGLEGTGLTTEYMLEADRDSDQKVNREEWLQFFDPIPDAEVEDMRAWLGTSTSRVTFQAEDGSVLEAAFKTAPFNLSFKKGVAPVVITKVDAGSNAEGVGVKIGMKIMNIEGQDTSEMTFDQILDLLKAASAKVAAESNQK